MLTRDSENVQLTQEEHTVLAASARGLHVWEVAQLLDQPTDITRQVIVSAKRKLGARSKLEAVVLALRRGFIDLSE
jgi:DNA-binding CsgD family transcriptional regulator